MCVCVWVFRICVFSQSVLMPTVRSGPVPRVEDVSPLLGDHGEGTLPIGLSEE